MGKYLDYYKVCLETGECDFLCNRYESTDGLIELFTPTLGEGLQHIEDGYLYSTVFFGRDSAWGCYSASNPLYTHPYQFTPMRQNVLLLMAVMNGEL